MEEIKACKPEGKNQTNLSFLLPFFLFLFFERILRSLGGCLGE